MWKVLRVWYMFFCWFVIFFIVLIVFVIDNVCLVYDKDWRNYIVLLIFGYVNVISMELWLLDFKCYVISIYLIILLCGVIWNRWSFVVINVGV